MTGAPAPCPICGLAGGFHADGPSRWPPKGECVLIYYPGHATTRTAIPAHLRRPGNKAQRRAEIARRLDTRLTTTKER